MAEGQCSDFTDTKLTHELPIAVLPVLTTVTIYSNRTVTMVTIVATVTIYNNCNVTMVAIVTTVTIQ